MKTIKSWLFGKVSDALLALNESPEVQAIEFYLWLRSSDYDQRD